MLLVLVRSRPGQPRGFEHPMAAANWPCVAGSPSTIASSSADAASRSAGSLGVLASTGSALSGDTRMRSMAASASAGRVSHAGERDSHSFGPRLPNS
jgi:hypothetical protein